MMRTEAEIQNTHVKITLKKNQYNVLGFGTIYVPKEKVDKWINTDFILRFAKFRVNKKPSNLKFENVFKQCAATKQWYSLDNFKLEQAHKIKQNQRIPHYILRSSSWEYDYHNQSNSLQKFKRDIYISDVKFRNMSFIKLWQYGDKQAELKCLVSRNNINKIIPNPFKVGDDPINTCTFYLHHLKVKDGVSVTKDYNPAELIINPSLLTNITMLSDIMGTILLEDSAHKMIHSLYQDSDYTMYRKQFLPFGLQSKKNWNIVMKEYPILKKIDYNNFMKNLKN